MLYHSMNTVVIFTVVCVILLIWLATLRNPFLALVQMGREMLHSYKFLVLFVCMFGVLVLNKYELQFETKMNLSADYTRIFFGLEGHFVRYFQDVFYASWLTPIIVFFYIFMLQSVLAAAIGVYLNDKNRLMVYATCYAVIIIYAIAIPFFLFFPVNEAWSYAPAGVRFLMLDVFPNFEQEYRALSGLNNCFPSLHTAISMTMALLAWRSGNRRWIAITTVTAAVIIFGIFYLGIHWLMDMLGGTVLAVAASSLAMKLAKVTLQSKDFQVQRKALKSRRPYSYEE
ncbi:phosphatase PAP2 family protein [Paenibacillus spiritus]|nr:phosphatase PAP2 family protein [Paenibacillus spiritus]